MASFWSTGLSQYEHDPVSIPSPSTMGSFHDIPGSPSIKSFEITHVLFTAHKSLHCSTRMLPLNPHRTQLRFFRYHNNIATDYAYSLFWDQMRNINCLGPFRPNKAPDDLFVCIDLPLLYPQNNTSSSDDLFFPRSPWALVRWLFLECLSFGLPSLS